MTDRQWLMLAVTCALPLATALITIAADWFDAWLEKRLTFTIPAVGEVRS